jgi:hypothetical protein
MLCLLQSPYIRALKFIHKIPIVNNMKGRVTLLALLLTLASAVSASGAVRLSAHSLCGSRCGQVATRQGVGTLNQTGTGCTYGTVNRGQIVIHLTGGSSTRSVSGWDRKWKQDGYTYFSSTDGTRMTYNVTGTWTVKIHATGWASTNTTAVGHGYIRSGTQTYAAWLKTHWTLGSGLNSSKWPHWPTAGKSFAIGG